MKDFFKFLFGGYWNDFDSNAVGGRHILIIVWAGLILSLLLQAIVIINHARR